MILTRRKFLTKLGYLAAGSLVVPYVPRVFYSIPRLIEPPYIITPDSPGSGRWIFVNSEIPIKSTANPKGIHDGKSFNTAYKDINDAFIQATQGDTIFLSDPGSYELGGNVLEGSGINFIGCQPSQKPITVTMNWSEWTI